MFDNKPLTPILQSVKFQFFGRFGGDGAGGVDFVGKCVVGLGVCWFFDIGRFLWQQSA